MTAIHKLNLVERFLCFVCAALIFAFLFLARMVPGSAIVDILGGVAVALAFVPIRTLYPRKKPISSIALVLRIGFGGLIVFVGGTLIYVLLKQGNGLLAASFGFTMMLLAILIRQGAITFGQAKA